MGLKYCSVCQRNVTPKSAQWGCGDLFMVLITLGLWLIPKMLLSRSGGRCPICNTKL